MRNDDPYGDLKMFVALVIGFLVYAILSRLY